MSQIHGKTKIELYNPNTKIKKITESENVFQGQYIAKYLRPLGYADVWMQNETYNRDLWKTTLGGILLFRDPIVVGTQYMPSTNKMVGNGSFNWTNTGHPYKLGSYNSGESSQNADCSIVTQVYDFATNQANGEIGSICLTSQVGGLMGYGNGDDFIQFSKPYTIRGNFESGNSSLNGQTDYSTYYNGWVYSVDCNYQTKKITFYKRKYLVTTCSLRDEAPATSVVVDTLELGFNSSDFNSSSVGMSINKGKILIHSSGSNTYVQPGSSFNYLQYDPSTDTFSRLVVTNNTEYTLYYPTNTYNGIIANDILSAAVYNGSTVIGQVLININTGTAIRYFPAAFFGQNTGSSLYTHIGEWIDNNSVILYLSGAANTSTHKWLYGSFMIYNLLTDTAELVNIKYFNSDNNYETYQSEEDIIFTKSYRTQCYLNNNPLYLATINNLPSPITKTSSDTMKITYTLTEV